MAIVVDPNTFKVPYAIGSDGALHQIADGRPKCESLHCPICRTPVSCVKEIEARAAHFRHHARDECDALAAYHRKTLHDAVRDAALALLQGGTSARKICFGGEALPSGKAVSEAAQDVVGEKHRPDIVVYPAEGERAPVLELEVVLSHKPEPSRVERAAADGRLIGVLDIAPIERDYYRKLWASEAFDIPEACRTFVLDNRFGILDTASVRRAVRGVLDRKYLKARIRTEDRFRAPARPLTQPIKGARTLPTHPPECALCGASDWTVSVATKNGETFHVGCAPATKIWSPTGVDKTSRQDPENGPF